MNAYEVILEFIRALLVWPLTGLILGLILIYHFKGAIISFLSRIVKAEGYGVRLETGQQLNKENITPGLDKALSIAPGIIKSRSDLIQYIKSHPEESVKLSLGFMNIIAFERAFNLIFGSQIRLLERLLQKGDEGEKYINLAIYYDEYTKLAKSKEYPIERYFGFLEGFEFMKINIETPERKVVITPFGIEFLSYIRSQFPLVYSMKLL